MEILKKLLIEKLEQYNQENPSNALTNKNLDKIKDIFPFNKLEYVLSFLLGNSALTFEEYCRIKSEYEARNKYLSVFQINAPRDFGENWAQKHLNDVVKDLEVPSTKMDPTYSGEYDFWYKGIKIEVKASRAVDRDSKSTLVEKALDFSSSKRFNMNFQQLKPDCCNVFVWIGVWKDKIVYWVLSSKEVEKSIYFSRGQHRGNSGEGQIWVKESNIKEFDSYKVDKSQILSKIIEKSKK